jgi:serine/threonine protein kinase
MVRLRFRPFFLFLLELTNLPLVLYSSKNQHWKIADFGTSSEATSKQFCTTRYSRGTSSYRAPEILDQQNPRYNNKADIWALGCIIYEVFTGTKAFNSDLAVFAYRFNNDVSVLENILSPLPIAELRQPLSEMLSPEPSARPTAQSLFYAWQPSLPALSFDCISTNESVGVVKTDVSTGARCPRVLSLDGGGVRALSSLFILQDLMEEVGRRNPTSKAPVPSEYFDLICGTEAGGLIAIMIGCMQMVRILYFWILLTAIVYR